MFFKFPNSIRNLIILNESILQLPEESIIHCVAHEFAHKVAGRGKTNLLEKEAEELILEWGFERESHSVNYGRPIMESEGYKMGHAWAKCQREKDLDKFKHFYQEWNEGRLTRERLTMLFSEAEAEISTIMQENITFEEIDDDENEEDTIADENIFDDEEFLYKGIVWGIMGFLEERKKT